MFDDISDEACPRCGFVETKHPNPPVPPYWPWHIRGERGVRAYVETLREEHREWLLALFVDDQFNLLAVDTISRGDVASCHVKIGRIFWRGYALKAAGFILVHNHPSGDPTPSADDVRASVRLADIAQDCDLPMLDHFIVAKDGMRRIAWF